MKEDVALCVAVFAVSFLAAFLSHDIMTRSGEEFSCRTTLECVVAHGVFLAVFLWSDVNFPKIAALHISKNLEGGMRIQSTSVEIVKRSIEHPLLSLQKHLQQKPDAW